MSPILVHVSLDLTQRFSHYYFFFFFNDTATTEIYTLSLHDALPIFTESASESAEGIKIAIVARKSRPACSRARSEEHTSELQSRSDLVCRLLLEKKKKKQRIRQLHITKHSRYID